MSRNTPEYRGILKATGKLTKVLKNNITLICVELVSNDLITPEQQKHLRNPNHDATERAADLVQLLTDKVEENPTNYHTLVKILEEDKATYKDVLECLALPSDPVPPGPPAAAGAASGSSGQHLNEKDHLTTVYSAVRDARAKYYFIGLELGLDPNDLDNVQVQFRGDTDDSLRKVLQLFLRRGSPPPTWNDLAKALESPGVGYGALAQKVRNDHM